MKCIVQRVLKAEVVVAGEVTGSVDRGLLVLAGVHKDDTDADRRWMGERLVGLRVFPDAEGKMNLSVAQAGGGVLLIPNFTLCAQTGKGHRPSFIDAMPPAQAELVFTGLCDAVAAAGVPTARGVFGAHMEVSLVNDGPITIVLDSLEHKARC